MPRAARVIVRSFAGVVGIGVAIAVIGVATLVPLPSIRHAPVVLPVAPVPASQELICAGSFLRLGDETGKDISTPQALGVPTTVTAATSGAVLTDPLSQQGDQNDAASAPIVLRAPTSAGQSVAPTLAGSQTQTVDSGDYFGLTASECAQASTEIWLVGGSTAVGRTTLIALANPSGVVATIDIAIFGENGQVTAPGSTGILVSPHSQKVFSLAGFAPNLTSPVVHVSSKGGPVVAFLEQAVVRGIDPGGVDIVGPTADPATTATIPGMVINNSALVEAQLGQPGYEDMNSVLRVFAPANKSAAVTLNIVPESPADVGASFTINLEAGRVTEIPIEELKDGVYSVTLKSKVPIVASVRVTSASAPATGSATPGSSDFAWFASASPLAGTAFATIATADNPLLHLANPGIASTTVTLHPDSGPDVVVAIPPRSSVSAPVTAGASYELHGFATIYASVSFVSTAGIASYLVSSSTFGVSRVNVYP